MPNTTTSTQYVREAPEIEAYKLGLLQLSKDVGSNPINLPQQNVSGLSDLTQLGIDQAASGIGQYQPFMDRAQAYAGFGGDTVSGVGSLAEQSAMLANQMPQVGSDSASAASLAAGDTGNSAFNAVQGAQVNANPFLNQIQQSGIYGQNAASDAMSIASGLQGQTDPFTNQMSSYAQQLANQGGGLGSISSNTASNANTLAQQGSGSYDPNSVSAFMDPYQREATQGMLDEMNRQSTIDLQSIRGQAVGQGAFGGSRQAVAERELERSTAEQKNRLIANQFSQNFQQAQATSLQSFEEEQRRKQAASQVALQGGQLELQAGGLGLQGLQSAGSLTGQAGGLGLQAGQTGIAGLTSAGQMGGQLGLQAGQSGLQNSQYFGNLGSQTALGIGGLQTDAALKGGALSLQGLQAGQSGLQGVGGLLNQTGSVYGDLSNRQGNLAQLDQGLYQNDARFAGVMGQIETDQNQKVLDTQYQNQIADAYEPYERIGFMSDIYKGAPSSQSAISQNAKSDPSTLNQALGTGIQALAAYKGFESLF